MLLTVLKWSLIIGIISILIIAVALHFIDFTASQDEIEQQFAKIRLSPQFKTAISNDRVIFYMTVGDTSKQAVLFVHGSPGSWGDFRYVFTDSLLTEKFYFISMDRPGFGKSGEGNPERSLQKQAEAVSAILRQEEQTAILVGHSYGGPVIVRAAIDHSELVDALIIVAGSVDPNLEKTKWYQIPVHYKVLSWILPNSIYSTNEEILALKNELNDMTPKWSSIKQPVSIIQGGKDILVPAANADYANNMLENTSPEMIVIPDMNHFIPWTNPQLIADEISRLNEVLVQKKSPNE